MQPHSASSFFTRLDPRRQSLGRRLQLVVNRRSNLPQIAAQQRLRQSSDLPRRFRRPATADKLPRSKARQGARRPRNSTPALPAIGSIRSPRPRQTAAPEPRKNGTSLPISAANSCKPPDRPTEVPNPVDRDQSRCRIARPASQARSRRNPFGQLHHGTESNAGAAPQQFNRSSGDVVVSLGQLFPIGDGWPARIVRPRTFTAFRPRFFLPQAR